MPQPRTNFTGLDNSIDYAKTAGKVKGANLWEYAEAGGRGGNSPAHPGWKAVRFLNSL
jgi:hypothetical protein